MDRRSWPWKKKSSDKGSTTDSAGKQTDQESAPSVNYVQVTPEAYARFNEMEKQLEDLNEKLSFAQTEMTNKDNLVKQHAKVAEEAVSGWEKAELEAEALKHQLETVTLSKLASDERAAHLDGALKECMKQIRNVKEESEQKLHDVVFAKTKQWEKLKSEFESKICEFEQELMRANAENTALSRSLHERSNLIMKISEEKSRAEAEIELLKNSIQSNEREIGSLKYELHVVVKELEIRNEEKNMSVRSADVANRQHAEDVKKIAKLEAECQRLRGLVRKKLPGPAALAQMKLEVESLGRDFTDHTRPRRAQPPSPAIMESNLLQLQMQKENEFLTGRLLAMEEETKMLKEALSKRNSELQASRNTCAKTTSKLRSMEVQLLSVNNSPQMLHYERESNPPSLTSMSEDGNADDEAASCSESWANALMSELSGFKREKEKERESRGLVVNTTKSEGSSHLELMDDFLEMERLACQTNGDDAASSVKNDNNTKTLENGEVKGNMEIAESPVSKLRLRILPLLESDAAHQNDIGKVMESIKCALKDVQDELHLSSEETNPQIEELKTAVTQIHEFVASLGREATEIHGRASDNCRGLSAKIEELSACINKFFNNDEFTLRELIFALSSVLSEANEMSLSSRNNEGENNSVDCVDKVTLLENKVVGPTQEGCSSPDNTDFEELKNPVRVCSVEEYEQLKSEKKVLDDELAKCTEDLESTRIKLEESEKALLEVRCQLAESQKANGLADTQLKCMAESYKSLEVRKTELEQDIEILKEKIESLNDELDIERKGHEEDLAKYKELQEQMEKNEDLMCVDADEDIKAKQEREITAAAEKLAECQETILFLGRQLQALRPPESKNRDSIDHLSDDERVPPAVTHSPRPSGQFDPTENYNLQMSPSDAETGGSFAKSPVSSKRPKHRSPSLSGQMSEKPGRGFSRFFSKGKSDN